ncbi:MAG TPA: 16S rRNA (guanine(966)-N(2))-methyltransferase RsmD [Aeromicrobium sp.]|nr:16S rRNA (guanine(966)-N(2))-methyltransferase RsmD [Aeromicrobium sp.]
MTRVIAGEWGGRRLAAPKGSGTRPTSDRVREALFSSLESELGGFDGLRVFDLFAGSGALGLEALSRGAAHADFVEADRKAADVIRRNIAALGVPTARARIHATSVERFVGELTAGFDLAFLDPPYRMPSDTLAAVVEALPEGGLIVVERSSREPFAWPGTRSGLRERRYGETTLWYGR